MEAFEPQKLPTRDSTPSTGKTLRTSTTSSTHRPFFSRLSAFESTLKSLLNATNTCWPISFSKIYSHLSPVGYGNGFRGELKDFTSWVPFLISLRSWTPSLLYRKTQVDVGSTVPGT